MIRTPDGTRVSDYDYELPPGRVARFPAERRDGSRLLVVPPGDDPFRHLAFADLVGFFEPGDVLVVNESKVLPARLLGRKPTGAPAEILLVRPASGESAGGEVDPHLWEALVRPGGKLKPGRTVDIAEDLRVEILDSTPAGGRIVRLDTPLTVEEALDRHGHVPLPPYIDREDQALDRERYQTVYARAPGSVAAPTAGLHFTHELLSALETRGVTRAAVTLHVGIGTFRPVETDDPAAHDMHHEWYDVSEEAARLVGEARDAGRRVWAVGTTAVRTLESAADEAGRVRSGSGTTNLFIRPPHRFRVVDGLITNFHLPRSTLLMLVSALAGYERTMAAYADAVSEGYRFFSYGDAMAVLPHPV
ncbi:MAG: tRNA preQ1(34) S-adenosylmethionine ribosyltransferase-isomerase QueA [Gemmatimonadota bacterium]|nr:tRNA preQ1(34) S-adenosylmethionine ribosyltransferase-isomerase QueA [Gemmatimonadota bacterium]MDH5759023.1 tRNA preQ1(34) S-adenosylmethionine ribosyltransferase-isomerase QueA [Gemmatimonadota bacterium]